MHSLLHNYYAFFFTCPSNKKLSKSLKSSESVSESNLGKDSVDLNCWFDIESAKWIPSAQWT